jgi:hypothetical protein
MTILLRKSTDLPDPQAYEDWLAVTGTAAALDLTRKLPNLAERLEDAFVAERETWWALGRSLSAEPSADIAHMPTAGSVGSDFGIMLAWGRLIGGLGGEDAVTLVLCDDPWLFRHLSALEGVDAGTPPVRAYSSMKLILRGVAARAAVALRCALAALRLVRGRRTMAPGGPVILVYGHPASNAQGFDAYFGNLMEQFSGLKRVLHTDCPVGRARELSTDERTTSLHAWGNPLFALGLILSRWRPGGAHLRSQYGWLIRRARALENGGGGPAMNRWQMHCQERFLTEAKPDRVLWPWENHGWERGLCRTTQRLGIATIGYQHTVIGPHHFNYSTATNADGLDSIPDVVVADGPAYLDELQAWGVPAERLVIGGAFRFPRFGDDLYDPKGPMFVPLSAIPQAAHAQIEVARTIAESGQRVWVKQHPMYPVIFDQFENLVRANQPLAEQKGLSAVLYTTGASGLEAILMGIPAFRLMLDDRIAIDVLPRGVGAMAVSPENAAEKILEPKIEPARILWEDILSDPDMALWKKLLFDDMDTPASRTKEIKQAS